MGIGAGIGLGVVGAGSATIAIPQQASLSLWLSAATGITLVGSDVSVWADQSGDGSNYTASSNRPEYEASFDGAPCVSFVAASSESLQGPVIINPNSDYTLAFVFRPAAGDGMAWSQCNSAVFGASMTYFRHATANSIHGCTDSTGANAEAGSNTSSVDNWHCFFLRRTGALLRSQVDGNTQATAAVPAGSVVGANRSALGARYDNPGLWTFMGGKFRAVGAWDLSLSDAEIVQLRNLYKATWPGLP